MTGYLKHVDVYYVDADHGMVKFIIRYPEGEAGYQEGSKYCSYPWIITDPHLPNECQRPRLEEVHELQDRL